MEKNRKKELSDFLNGPPLEIIISNEQSWNIYDQAFTHSTYAKEKRDLGIDCSDYERLEFLGDKVLGLIVSDYLYSNNKFDSEGEMTKQMEVVSNEILADIINKKMPNIEKIIRIGKGESIKDSIVADVFEALIGAIYRDTDYERVRKITLDLLSNEILNYNPMINYKCRLQEYTQKNGLPLPDYSEVTKSGPDHSPTFKVNVKIQGEVHGESTRKNIKDAEKEAAKEALKRLM